MRRTRMAATALAMTALLAALPAAGCGGGDDESESLSRAELIEQADQICAEGGDQINAEAVEFSQDNIEDTEGLVTTIIVPGYRDQIEQFRELAASADQPEFDGFVDSFERATDQLEASPDDLAGGPAFDAYLDARREAKAFGMKRCAQGA